MKFESTFPVGKYTCHMMIEGERGQAVMIACEWQPDLPLPKSLSKAEMAQYRAGRDALVAKIAAALGGAALVIE